LAILKKLIQGYLLLLVYPPISFSILSHMYMNFYILFMIKFAIISTTKSQSL